MNPVLLYDGDCALCNHSVIFLLRLDEKEVLRYAPLDGNAAKNLLGSNYTAIRQVDAITLHYQDHIHVETDAIIQSLLLIKKYLWLAHLLKLTPRFLRNGLYRLVARHRDKIFKSCPVIPREYTHLFL